MFHIYALIIPGRGESEVFEDESTIGQWTQVPDHHRSGLQPDALIVVGSSVVGGSVC